MGGGGAWLQVINFEAYVRVYCYLHVCYLCLCQMSIKLYICNRVRHIDNAFLNLMCRNKCPNES